MNTGSLLSDWELARLRSPGLSAVECAVQLARAVVDELHLTPPVDPNLVASFRGISRIEVVPLDVAGCLVHQGDEVVARVRASDSRGRRRFSALHEVKHSFLPGFGVTQYRCDPAPPGGRSVRNRPDSIEPLADAGAAELLFPYTSFSDDIAGNRPTLDLMEQLAGRYDASLEATGMRLVNQTDTNALLLCLEPSVKPSEPNGEPQLRVRWSAGQPGAWPFIRKHKSVSNDSPFGRAMMGEIVDEIGDVTEVAGCTIEQVQISAKLLPITRADGSLRLRVLALLSSPDRRP